MAIAFDYDNSLISLTGAEAALLSIQDLINAIRLEEESEEGIQYPQIAQAAGKFARGGGVFSAIIVILNNPWKLDYPPGSDALISGGDLLESTEDNPIADSAGSTVVIQQDGGGVIVPQGSGLDAGQDSKLTEIHNAHYRRRKWDKVAKTVTIYAADGVTPLAVFDTDDDLTELTPQ